MGLINPPSPGLAELLASYQQQASSQAPPPDVPQTAVRPVDIRPGGDIAPAAEAPPAPGFLDKLNMLNPMSWKGPSIGEAGAAIGHAVGHVVDPMGVSGLNKPAEAAPKEAPAEKKAPSADDLVQAPAAKGAAEAQAPSTLKLPGGGGPGGVAEQSTIGPKAQAVYDAAIAEGKSADQAMAESTQSANESKADTQLVQAAQQHAEVQKMEAAQAKRNNALADQETEIRHATKLAENGKLDPSHFWHSRTAGQQALGLISLFLHGLSGDKGPSVIERATERDIDAQKVNLQNNWKSVEAQNSLLNRMVQRFGNEEVGEAAARAVRTQQYGLLALSEATRAQSPMLIAKARQELARGSMEQAQFKIAHEKLVQTGGGGIDLKAINAAVLAERSKRIAAGEPWDPAIEAKTRASITSGMYGRDIGAPEVPGMMQKGGAGPKAGRMARDLVKYESNTKALDELSRMSEKAGAGPMGLEDQRRASILQQSLEQNGVTIPGLGMVSRWTGGELAGIQAAKAQQQRQLEIARRVVATGGAGGGEEKDTSAADEGISEE